MDIHDIQIHYLFLTFFWVLASGLPSGNFYPWFKPLVTPRVKTFSNVIVDIEIACWSGKVSFQNKHVTISFILQYSVAIWDTEGTSDPTRSQNNANTIFGLAAYFSSVLLLNVKEKFTKSNMDQIQVRLLFSSALAQGMCAQETHSGHITLSLIALG